MPAHESTVCAKDIRSQQYRKNWSYRFICPSCGLSRRFNTNFVGSRRHVVCDGHSLKAVPKPAGYFFQPVVDGLPRPFMVRDTTTGASHGDYETLDQALGCVGFDRLTEWQVWFKENEIVAQSG